MSVHPHLRPLAAAALVLLLGACFEEPVHEGLEIRFDPEGSAARLELTVSLLTPDEDDDNFALRSRLEGERQRLLRGEDDWAGRFERLDAASHDVTFAREHGVLAGVEQTAQVDLSADPEALQRFFSDTLVSAFYRAEDGRAELSLQPLAAGRATRRQRQLLDRALGTWTRALAQHFAATDELYGYLDEHPDRAADCFSVLLEDVLPEEDGGRRSLLTEDEAERVEAVEETIAAGFEVLTIGAQEAYSINEISRLAFDPFPASLHVVPGGPVVEAEGFVPDGEGGLGVRSVTLWNALAGLEGRWVSPDPLLLYVRQSGGPEGGGGGGDGGLFDLDEVVAMERFHAPAPDADEVRLALEGRLVPEPLYRVVWKTAK